MNNRFKEVFNQPVISYDEMTAAIQALTPTELRILDRLLEEHDVEEAFEIFASMIDDANETAGATEYYFKNTDPYVQRDSIPDLQAHHDFKIDGDGNIRVKNLSAFWLPKFTLQREYAGTVYSVMGSYDGTETLDRKVKRILDNNLENMEAYE